MRMRNEKFRRFLNVTQLMIFSNNQEYDNENRVPIQGAFYCCSSRDKAFFNVFREADKDFVTKYPYKTVDEAVAYIKEFEKELEEMAKQYNMELDQIKQFTTDADKETIKKDIAVQKAAKLVVDAAK